MKILVVDDDEVTRKLLMEVLRKEGYSVSLASDGEEAVSMLKREIFPVILSDIRMLELDGMAVLREVKRSGRRSAVILMTGFGSMEGAIDAIREGAFDYVSKPFKMDDLKAVVARAVKHWESLIARPAGSTHGLGRNDAAARVLVGKSARIFEVYKTLARAALSTSNVLVVGENGTGKELVARAIHDNSQRRSRGFVVLNCAALTDKVSEAELLEQAGDALEGTLFLDGIGEVGDIGPAVQIKILRMIEQNPFRVIAATHRDLDAMVRAGRFREDLYYRLKVISIDLPPLRERMEDLPALVEQFLSRYSEKSGKAISHISDEAMAILRSYPWPGNIRELEHAIERAVALTGTAVLFPEDFPLEIVRRNESVQTVSSLEEMERTHILKVLREVNFNKSKASEVLGIDRATLYRKAQRYGIDLRAR